MTARVLEYFIKPDRNTVHVFYFLNKMANTPNLTEGGKDYCTWRITKSRLMDQATFWPNTTLS